MADSRRDHRGVSRVLTKLQSSIEAGNYYEAHQMYRTLYFRYNAQKKYAEAIDLIYTGASTLLDHGQFESGADLAMLLIEILNSANIPASDQTIDKLISIHKKMEQNSQDRMNFVNSAVRWARSADVQQCQEATALHKRLAFTLWEEKNYVDARYHFLHSTDGENCAEMLIEYHVKKGFPSEVDCFIAQAVLQYLCLKKKHTAHIVFFNYTSKHPQLEKGPPFLKPLLNFIWFLLFAVDSGKLTVFTILCEQYQPSINRDPTYSEYLDRIGQIFFGVPPPQPRGSGMLDNLIQSLFGNGGDDADEDAQPGTSGINNSSPAAVIMQPEDLD
ncbi:Golgi to ER traffic protein 4 homolog [Tubulanus polymorphus]|uniref:Golgi to ER traffic protein 4 homolog n=1 Tax=Tubulanus polymorphus TaxID=672921 RepID=UPI003DA2CDFE